MPLKETEGTMAKEKYMKLHNMNQENRCVRIRNTDAVEDTKKKTMRRDSKRKNVPLDDVKNNKSAVKHFSMYSQYIDLEVTGKEKNVRIGEYTTMLPKI